jgi:hypothetical protein
VLFLLPFGHERGRSLVLHEGRITPENVVIINLSSAERNSAATLCSDDDWGQGGMGGHHRPSLGRFTAMSEVPICVGLKPTWKGESA